MRVTILPVIILIILAVLADYYILYDIRQYCNKRIRKVCVYVYSIISVLFWALIIVALCLPRSSASESILPVMWMLYIFISFYIPKIVYIFFSALGRLCFLIFKKKRNKFNYFDWIGLISACFIFILMWWGVFETRRNITVNQVEIQSHNLPSSFNGFKIVQFSDAHVGTWGNDTTFVFDLVNQINNQKPDIILFTGDIVNRESSEIESFKKILARLSAPYGVYAVMGNHDYSEYIKWENEIEQKEDVAKLNFIIKEELGWNLLNNEHDFIKVDQDSIALIGVENWGEPPFSQRGDLKTAYPENLAKNQGLYDDNFKILMTHNPKHWSSVVTETSNIDLSLSGHTHAMQMMVKIGDFKWSPVSFRYKEWGGLYSKKSKDGNDMHLYVNIGSGEVGIPSRIGAATPEITVFTLRRVP